ncbi:hypothetical protein ACP0HG_25905, partial [Escherichia coli]|uniref:hypothetical protein n=2 Tax=Pseudomonadota TaxID=1224 RepID=UPI003CE7C6DA
QGFQADRLGRNATMQKPKPYRAPRRRPLARALPPRRLRRVSAPRTDTDFDIVFEWEADAPTQH